MYNLTLEDIKKMSLENKGNIFPVCKEMYLDMVTPIMLLRILQASSKHCFLLESVIDSTKWGRYSFLGFEPDCEITCMNGVININQNGKVSTSEENPSVFINDFMKNYKSPKFDNLPPFTGGLVGYFAYDYIKYQEPSLKLDAKDEENFKDMDLMLFKNIIAIDNFKQKIIIISNVVADDNVSKDYEDAKETINNVINIIKAGKVDSIKEGKLLTPFNPLFSKEEFCKMVDKAKNYIFEGDIFQVVLSNRLCADFSGSLLNVYRKLRTVNPSPYMFYFSSNDVEIAGASPETLVKSENGIVHTFPLAGTRKRGETDKQDELLAKELLDDKKELAEHNMLVDLGRNDLGKICKFRTVKVDEYMKIHKFSHVMHIGSTVVGELDSKHSAINCIDAVLPAGTLSGAPKIRACEIINELENNKRGIYGGAIGYIGFTGDLDTCISIRLVFKKNGKIFVRSGAGIVYDSVAESEYEECINKAKALVSTIENIKEGEFL